MYEKCTNCGTIWNVSVFRKKGRYVCPNCRRKRKFMSDYKAMTDDMTQAVKRKRHRAKQNVTFKGIFREERIT